jgi:hypothetical protein
VSASVACNTYEFDFWIGGESTTDEEMWIITYLAGIRLN